MTILDDFKFIKETIKRLKKGILEGTWIFDITENKQFYKVGKAIKIKCRHKSPSKIVVSNTAITAVEECEKENFKLAKNNNLILTSIKYITFCISFDENDNTFYYQAEYILTNDDYDETIKNILNENVLKASDEYNVYKLIKLSMDELEKAQLKFILNNINS